MTAVHQSDPHRAPDDDFEPGRLDHLVPGNRGRLLDPRRTPVTVLGVRPDTGFVDLRIDAFEDEGATWAVPVEDIGQYQFPRGAATADPATVRALEEASRRLDVPLVVAADLAALPGTRARLAEATRAADDWLARDSSFFARPEAALAPGELPDPESRRGDPRLFADLEAWLDRRDLRNIDAAFARQWASNPHAGELVKGHRLVAAELGLSDFSGKVVRDPGLFDGEWSRERRAEHLLARMGFVHAVFGRTGRTTVDLWRGVSTEGVIEPHRRTTFLAASFARAVAESLHDATTGDANRVLHAWTVPVERLVMTFFETRALNDPYREAEAVLLVEPTGTPPYGS